MAGLILAAAFGAVADAMAVEMAVAQPTYTSASTPTFRFPQITAPPSVHELMKRQEAHTFLVGPDNTCGYVDGISSSAYYCEESAALCAFMTYSDTGARACCNLSTCGFVVDCVDYRQIRTSGACDSDCMRDDVTLKCSNAATPYCGTVTFFSGIQDYYCMTTPVSSVESIYTTWVGQDDGRRFTPLVLTITTGNPDPFGTESAVGGSGSSATARPGSAPSSSPAPNNGGGSSNTGAIVGGVVGGLAVLALLALGIFFIVRHGKKNKPVAPPPGGAYPPMAQDPHQPGPDGIVSPHQSVYQNPPGPTYVPSASPPPPPDQQQQLGYAPAPAYYPADAPGKQAQTYTTYAVPPSPASPAPTDQRLSMQPPPPSTSPTVTEGGAPTLLSQNSGGGYQPQQQQQQQHQHYNGATSGATVFYESGGDAVGAGGPHANHHGQFHEMG